MLSWQSIILVFAALAAAGASLDKLVPLRHKKSLHVWMIGLWVRLDSKRTPDLPAVLAGWLLKQWEIRFYRRFWRLFIEYAVAGWAVLSLAALAGNLLPAKQDTITLTSQLPANYHNPTFIEAVPLPHFLAYLAIVPFDCLTIAITVWGLRRWKQARLRFKLLTAIVCASVTLGLGVLCFASVCYANAFAFNHDLIGMGYARQLQGMINVAEFNYLSKQNPEKTKNLQISTNVVVTSVIAKCNFSESAKQGAITLGRLVLGRKAPETSEFILHFCDGNTVGSFSIFSTSNVPTGALLLTGTVFFPSLAIFAALVGMIIAKGLLAIGRFSALYLIDLSTEPADKDFAPGTLLGIVFSLLVILLNTVVSLLGHLGK